MAQLVQPGARQLPSVAAASSVPTSPQPALL
jgi:hypothetical protein